MLFHVALLTGEKRDIFIERVNDRFLNIRVQFRIIQTGIAREGPDLIDRALIDRLEDADNARIDTPIVLFVIRACRHAAGIDDDGGWRVQPDLLPAIDLAVEPTDTFVEIGRLMIRVTVTISPVRSEVTGVFATSSVPIVD